MYFRYLLRILAFALLLLIPAVNYSQDQSSPVVGIVVDASLDTLSLSGSASDSIRQLTSIFQSLGAEVRGVDLANPIAEDIDVVVLVRPMRTLSISQLARLWLHIERGNHLLLALDPHNYRNVVGELSEHSISRLLEFEFGIGLRNDFLAERWFTTDSLEAIEGSRLLTYPEDIIAHPIVAPLLAHELPVHVWGGRSLDVEPFVPDARAVPLIYTETAYGEVNSNFARDSQALLLRVDSDNLGRLLVATIAESSLTGSRVALLGDSELLQDSFGLSQISGTTRSHFAGNRIFVQRLAAWLLGIPESEWPLLPGAYTWIAVDGLTDDWGEVFAALEGDIVGNSDIQVYAFSNDQFLYILAEAADLTPGQVQVEIIMSEDEETRPVIRIDSLNTVLAGGRNDPISDATMAINSAVEIRLPLRVVGRNTEIASVCLFTGGNPFEPQVCSGDITPLRSSLFDPAPMRFQTGPLVTVSANGPINLHSAPSDNAPFVGVAQNGEVFSAAGRNEEADWIKVENGRFSGWAPDFLVTPNTDVLSLPVVR